jgi:hypothetical protein
MWKVTINQFVNQVVSPFEHWPHSPQFSTVRGCHSASSEATIGMSPAPIGSIADELGINEGTCQVERTK